MLRDCNLFSCSASNHPRQNQMCLVCSLTLCAAAQENIVLDTNDLAETPLLSPPC